jgi:hypothetical protein
MNERLQELADQAQKYVYEMFDGNIDRNTERFKVKFAELIVQDCVSEVALMGVTNFENEDISWACRVIIDGIKNKFGV